MKIKSVRSVEINLLLSTAPPPQHRHFLFVCFLAARLNACVQLHLGSMRENLLGDLEGFVSLKITSVWEVTKVS